MPFSTASAGMRRSTNSVGVDDLKNAAFFSRESRVSSSHPAQRKRVTVLLYFQKSVLEAREMKAAANALLQRSLSHRKAATAAEIPVGGSYFVTVTMRCGRQRRTITARL